MIITSKEELLKQNYEFITLENARVVFFHLKKEIEKNDQAVGMAAPQLGIHSKIFVVKTDKGLLCFINSEIVEKSEPFVFKNEGCISFPGIWLDTVRYNKIKIKHKDFNTEKEIIEEHFGFAAVAIQHEQDHIDSILFFDRKVPEKYDPCFCGSKEKFKFCCLSKLE